jgi:hypothetical protein
MASSTIAPGRLLVVRSASTTFSRLVARCFFWPLASAMVVAQLGGLGLEVEVRRAGRGRLGAHAAGEVVAEPVAHVAVDQLLLDQLLGRELLEGVQDLVEVLELVVGPDRDGLELLLDLLAFLLDHVGLGALGLELGEGGLELGEQLLAVDLELLLDLLLLGRDLLLELGQRLVPRLSSSTR